MQPQKIEISHKTIIFTIILLCALILAWQLRSIFYLLFFCFIFMESLNPVITKLQKLHLPRPLAIILMYSLILSIISFALASIVPLLVEQTRGLITVLPSSLENVKIMGFSAIDFSSQIRILENIPATITSATISVVSNLFSIFIIFVITFYLLLERDNFEKYSISVFGNRAKFITREILKRTENRIGSWVGAELMLMVIVGLLSYLGYLVLGLEYAVPLAILAGLLEIIPNIGPTITTILAAIVGLTISLPTCLLVVVWGIVVQQVENNFIVPKVMKESIGLHPLVTILLIAAGAKIGGFIGAIMTIPTFLTFEAIIHIFTENKTKS